MRARAMNGAEKQLIGQAIYVNVKCGVVMSCVFCNLSNVGKSEILSYSLCCPFHRFHSSHECKVPQKQWSSGARGSPL